MKLIKKFATGLAAGALMAATPALAQDEEAQAEMSEDGDPLAAMFEGLGSMFAVEPLTEEQESRLPLAQAIVAKIIPDGAMAEMMDGMMGGTLGSIMELAGETIPNEKLAEKLGVSSFELNLSNEEAAELLSVFDPQWEERQRRENALMPGMMSEMMTVMEPTMRKAMSELYAINFTSSELGEIDAFFATSTGASFARKSFSMASDPRVMAASMEALPAMMGAIATIDEKLAEATADLAPVRSFEDLTDAQKARVTEATGLTEQEILDQLNETEISAEGSWEE